MTTSRSERRAAERRAAAPRRAPAEAPERVADPPALDATRATRAALVLGATVALLLAARAAGAFAPGMHAWGFDALRAAPPWAGWPLWVAGALALLPAVGGAASAPMARLGDAIGRGAPVAMAGVALAAAALVLALPDRLWLMGDFMLRLGCARGTAPVSMVFPQAMPLDLLLHHTVPVELARRQWLEPHAWERLLGAAQAAALGASAVAFARALALRGAAAAACAGTLAFTGHLAMFTGYGKSLVELTLLTVVAATLALRLIAGARVAWPLGIAVTAAILGHRSGLALLPLLAVAGALAWRLPSRAAVAHRSALIAAMALPVAAAIHLAPRIAATLRAGDPVHLAPQGAGAAAVLGAAFAPAHFAELANRIGATAPLVFALPALALALGGAWKVRRRELAVLGALAVPAAAVLLFVHPGQGAFRDADVLAPSLAALATVTAMLAGDALRGAPWLAPAVLLAALLPAVQQLAIASDTDRGVARVVRYLESPPSRGANERALTWAFVGERELWRGRKDAAAAALERAVELAPSPRLLLEWAMAEADRGQPERARGVYRRLVERMPTLTEGWLGLGWNALRLGDHAAAREAAERAAALEPQRADVRALARAAGEGAGDVPR